MHSDDTKRCLTELQGASTSSLLQILMQGVVILLLKPIRNLDITSGMLLLLILEQSTASRQTYLPLTAARLGGGGCASGPLSASGPSTPSSDVAALRSLSAASGGPLQMTQASISRFSINTQVDCLTTSTWQVIHCQCIMMQVISHECV